MLMLLPFAVLAAGVREHQRRVLRLIVAAAEAVVLGHCVLSVAVVAVGARPAVEREQLLRDYASLTLSAFLLQTLRSSWLLLFFLFVVLIVEFLDPPLDAAQVEGLPTLATVPQGALLVDAVVADEALLRALGQGLHQVGALLRKTPELLQEVIEVVLDEGFVLGRECSLGLFFVLDYRNLFLPRG